MGKRRPASTAATRALDAAGVRFELCLYAYEDRGGTRVSARELGVDEHAVIKTLVMQDRDKQPLVVLMHGDRQVSTKALARQLGRREVVPCAPDVAEKHTGYKVGGTSPFGMRRDLPVYLESTILDLEQLWVNGGKRGLLVSLAPEELVRVTGATRVDVAR